MELKNIKHGEIKWVKVYYEHIQELTHGLQTPTTYNFSTIVFWVGLQSYLKIATTRMMRTTLQLNKEVTLLCEE
jgi:hypothetical protein